MSDYINESIALLDPTDSVLKWQLRLYVAGATPKCLAAYNHLKKMCEEHIPGQYHIEVIDLQENPRLAEGDEIVAVPTLVRKLPPPIRKIIGDLSDTEHTLVGLQIRLISTSKSAENHGR